MVCRDVAGKRPTHLSQQDLPAVRCLADVHHDLHGWARKHLVARQVVQAHRHGALTRPVQAHAHTRARKQGLACLWVCGSNNTRGQKI